MFDTFKPVGGHFSQAVDNSTPMTAPSGATALLLQAGLAPIRYCFDGTDPTKLLGFSLQPGEKTIIPVSGGVALVLSSPKSGTLAQCQWGNVGEPGDNTVVLSNSFARPADTTAYASGDLVANSTTAGSVTPLSWTAARAAAGGGRIRRARVRKTGTGVTNASFRLHLYKASPVPTNGDNAAWLSTQAANYLGAMDIVVDKAFSDGAAGNGAPLVGSEINFQLASGQTIYGLLEARAAYTPASAETIDVALEVIQD